MVLHPVVVPFHSGRESVLALRLRTNGQPAFLVRGIIRRFVVDGRRRFFMRPIDLSRRRPAKLETEEGEAVVAVELKIRPIPRASGNQQTDHHHRDRP